MTIRPKQRISANLEAQAPNNSYSPPTFYEDITFACADCDKVETWTAAQQKQYYEEWKKPIYGTAKRCRECRLQRQREEIIQRTETKDDKLNR